MTFVGRWAVGYRWMLPDLTERMAYQAGQFRATVFPMPLISFCLGCRFSLRNGGRPAGVTRPPA